MTTTFKMSFLSFIALLSWVTTSTLASTELEFECLDDWNRIGTHCYYFVNVDVDFNDARDLCKKYGAHLVNIRDEVEAHDVAEIAANVFDTKHSFWVANYRDEANLSDSSEIGNYGIWQVNQPRDFGGKRAISSDMNGRWRISHSGDIRPFVCRTPACPEGTFRCKDGQCINMNWKCDSEFDCDDHTDETDCQDECSFYYKGDSGTMYTSNTYTNNAHCQWTIEGNPNSILKLIFSRLDLEDDVDVLNVYAGGPSWSASYLVRKVTGKALQSGTLTFYSPNNFFFVEFFTDSSVTKSGIQATWSSVPELERGRVTSFPVRDEFQEITTPFFSENEIPPYMTTEWKLIANDGQLIVLEVLSDVERELLVVNDVGTEMEIVGDERFVFISNSNEMRLVVKTKRMKNRQFRARFKLGCDVDLSVPFVKLFINDMLKDKKCTWKFTNPENLRFRATTTESNFHNNEGSYLKIYDSSEVSPANLVFTGNTTNLMTSNMLLGYTDKNMVIEYFSHRDSQMPDDIELIVTSVCPSLPDESSMTITDPDTEVYLEYNVDMFCDEGYSFGQAEYLPRLNATCRPSGKWMFRKHSNTRSPSCQIVYCGLPPQIDNGFIQDTGGNVTFGGTAEYSCANGFDISGSNTVVCQANGTWSEPPSCEAESCSSYPPLMNGNLVYESGDESAPYGTVIYLNCTDGYELIGAVTVVCNNKTWSYEGSYCSILTCPLPEVENGQFSSSDLPEVGGKVTVNCNEGFEIDGATTALLTCLADRSLEGFKHCSDKDECLEDATCGVNSICVNSIGSNACLCESGHNGSSCDRITEYPYSHCSDPNDASSCNCGSGYEIFKQDGQNDYNIPSGENGLREGDVLHINHTCIRKTCSIPAKESENSTELLSGKSVHYFEDEVDYYCPPYYNLTGESNSSCQADGSFENNPPACNVIMCDIPAASRLEKQISPDSRQLKAGDHAVISCLDERTNTVLHQRHIFCARDLNVLSGYSLQGDDPECPEIECGRFNIPGLDPAATTTNTSLGGRAEIICDSSRGFTKTGTSTHGDFAICEDNGRWNYQTLSCEGARCSDPGTLGGTIQYAPDGYEMDQLVYYECINASYVLEPAEPLLCVYDNGKAVWNSSAPICIDKTPPVIECPSSFELDLYDMISFDITAEDNSGFVRISKTSGPFENVNRLSNSTDFEYAAFDRSLRSNCSFSISLKDRSPPSLSCPLQPTNLSFTENDGRYSVNLQPEIFPITGDLSAISITPHGSQFVVPGEDLIVRATITNSQNGLEKQCSFIAEVDDLECSNKTIENVQNGKIENCVPSGADLTCAVICNDGYVLPNYASQIEARCTNSVWNKETSFFACYGTEALNQYFEGLIVYEEASFPLSKDPSCNELHSTTLKNHFDALPSPCEPYIFKMTDVSSKAEGFKLSSSAFTIEVKNFDDNSTKLNECAQKLLNNKDTVFNYNDGTVLKENCGFPWSVGTNDAEEITVSSPRCRDKLKQIDVKSIPRCVECLPGTFYDGNQCTECAKDEFNSNVGQTSCESCHFNGGGLLTSLGNVGTISQSGCVKLCPKGFMSSSGLMSESCEQCSENTYWVNSKTCSPCPNGGGTKGVAAAVDDSFCSEPCPVGQYSMTGYMPCESCPSNFYNDMTTQTKCNECPGDKYTNATAKTQASDCLDIVCDCDSNDNVVGNDCTREYHVGQCNCKDGFSGLQCQKATEICNPNPCYNDGTCYVNGASYTCNCTTVKDCVFNETAPLEFSERDPHSLQPKTREECENICLLDDKCLGFIHEPQSPGICFLFSKIVFSSSAVAQYSRIKVCNETAAFSGDHCEKDLVNDCTADSCDERDFCKDMVGDSSCVCPSNGAYQQPRCEKPGEVCDAAKCVHGTCKKYGNVRFVCECEAGFTGDSCETNIDDCNEDTCLHGGTCNDLINSYSCDCKDGYSGNNCENIPNFCESASCKGGPCRINHSNLSAICLCPDNYEWPDEAQKDKCEVIQYCNNSPCQNGAGCLNVVGGYTCNCPSGYEGHQCQHDIDNCRNQPCQNNGVCHDKLNTYVCDCPPGFDGVNCQNNIDDCRCEKDKFESCDDLIGDYKCICKPGYVGKNCSITKNECDDAPCQHGGNCTSSFNSFSCSCPKGWTGIRCESTTNYCSDDPCKNEADCYNTHSGPYCSCKGGTAGENCEKKSELCDIFGSFLCPNGECTEVNGTAKCVCAGAISSCELTPNKFIDFNSPRLEGNSVQNSIEECESLCLSLDDCEALIHSGGQCLLYKKGFNSRDTVGIYEFGRVKKCYFDPYYTGKSCELKKDHCAENPCGKDGVFGKCTIDGLSYKCNCDEVENFGGPQCKTPNNVCESKTCPESIKCHPYINHHGKLRSACLCPADQVLAGSNCKDVNTDYDLVFPMERDEDEDSFVTSIQGFYIDDEQEITIAFWIACAEEPKDWIIAIAESSQDPGSSEFEPIIAIKNDEIHLASDGSNETIPLENDLDKDFMWHFFAISLNKMGQYQTLFNWASAKYDSDSHQQLNFTLPQESFYFIHIGKGFSGYISQVNVWKSLVDASDLLKIYANSRFVPSTNTLALGWILYSRNVDIHPVRPSLVARSKSVCSISPTVASIDTCPNVDFDDKEYPKLVGECKESVTLVPINSSHQVTLERLNYEFDDGRFITNIPDRAMILGAHDLAVAAIDSSGNLGICMTRVYVTDNDCSDLPMPTNSTEDENTRAVACPWPKEPSIPVPKMMSCGELRSYNLDDMSAKPKEISCGLMQPLRVTITIPLLYRLPIPCDTTFLEGLKVRLTQNLIDATTREWSLCINKDSDECSNVMITAVCSDVSNEMNVVIILHDLGTMLRSTLTTTLNLTPAEVVQLLADNDDLEAGNVGNAVLITTNPDSSSVLNCIEGYGRQGDKCVQCGAGSFYIKDTEKCELCPFGKYTYASEMTECIPCPNGDTTLQKGSKHEDECIANCLPGTMYNESISQCTSCQPNFFQDEKGQDFCKPCPPATGTAISGANEIEDCQDFCEPGTELIDRKCNPCARGYFRVGNLQDRCQKCPTNFTTAEESSRDESECIFPQCPVGHFIDRSESPAECRVCDYGSYQQLEDQFECEPCDSMFTTNHTGSLNETSCIFVCPPGEERVGDTEKCEPCARGFYKGHGLEERFMMCTQCSDSSYTTAGPGMTSADNCTVARCYPGYFFNETNECQECIKGSYQSQEQQTSCVECDAHYDTRGPGANSSDLCEFVCADGQELDESEDKVCNPCARGYYKNAEMQFGQCEACIDNTTDSTESTSDAMCNVAVCGPGQVVSPNKAECLPCEVDTYQTMDIPYSYTTCTPCGNNEGTKEPGATHEANCSKICVAGQGLEGNVCNFCARGTWNNGNVSMRFEPCLACEEGLTTDIALGASSIDQCNIPLCAAGYIVSNDKTSCEECPFDTYQPMNAPSSTTECQPCAENNGTDSKAAISEESCKKFCVAGNGFNSTTHTCSLCPRGEWNNGNNSMRFELCESCPEGFTTELESGADDILACSQRDCPPGSFFDKSNGEQCTPCAIGTFQELPRQSSCEECPKNKNTSSTGSESSAACNIYCPAGEEDDGTEKCVSCDDDYYKTRDSFSGCMQCEGDVTSTAEDRTTCSEKFCDKGRYHDGTNCLECEIGFYKDERGNKGCTLCPGNYTTDSTGYTSRAGCSVTFCEAGYYSSDGDGCDPCATGFYKNVKGNENCTKCEENFTTAHKATTDSSSCDLPICPAGEYRDEKTCKDCETGKYQPEPGQTECELCETGYTTLKEGSIGNDSCRIVCPPGEYRNETTNTCHECMLGSYQGSSGKSECDKCDGNYTTDSTGSTSETECHVMCPKGYYGSSKTQCLPCSLGHYQNETDQNDCRKCPDVQGYEPSTLKQASKDIMDCLPLCTQGKFLDVSKRNCQNCPIGTYKSTVSLDTECTNCRDGFTTLGDQSVNSNDCSYALCKKGYHRQQDKEDCQICDYGTYQSEGNSQVTTCTSCGDGKTTLIQGAITIESCIADCVDGEDYDHETSKCVKCKVGYYRKKSEQKRCSYCPEGKTTLQPGSSSCIDTDVQAPDPPRRNFQTQMSFEATSCHNTNHLFNFIRKFLISIFVGLSKNFGGNFCKNAGCDNMAVDFGTCGPASSRKKRQTNNQIAATINLNDVDPLLSDPASGSRTDTSTVIGDALRDMTDSDELQQNGLAPIRSSVSVASSCLEGSVADSDSNCVPCEAGKYHNKSTNKCDVVPKGSYTDAAGKTSFEQCPAGQTTEGEGSNSQNSCNGICAFDSTYCKHGDCEENDQGKKSCVCKNYFQGLTCNEPTGEERGNNDNVTLIAGVVGGLCGVLFLILLLVGCLVSRIRSDRSKRRTESLESDTIYQGVGDYKTPMFVNTAYAGGLATPYGAAMGSPYGGQIAVQDPTMFHSNHLDYYQPVYGQQYMEG